MRKPEILAPAGSYEAFITAVHSGCDAIYLGGNKYGARAYAKNFNIDSLERALSYAKNFGVKVYYTINTLFKEKELSELMTHMEEVYQLGIDGVIVQDIGVLSLLNQYIPELELHASTQINCHSTKGVIFLKELGVKRVVLARELSLDEIKLIKKQTHMPIETFVHGALCYSYSGQCLMSSFMGGRSGNRGRCAQPCRLNYKVHLDDGVHDVGHVLSPKDIETLTVLPELIDAEIDSFKIEGRMKSKEYVGLMTSLYRHYTDAYIRDGSIEVKQKDLDDMTQIFNRGQFTNGYYFQHNNPEMITFDQPKHQGRVIGKIQSKKGNAYTMSIFEPLKRGDCLEVNLGYGNDYSWIVQNNNRLDYTFDSEQSIPIGQEVRRIKSIELMERLNEAENIISKKSIRVKVTLEVDQPLEMVIEDDQRVLKVIGDIVQEAKNQGLTEERVTKQFGKVDTYPIEIESIDTHIIGNVFMSMGQLNAIRREGFDRWLGILKKISTNNLQAFVNEKIKNKASHHKNITVLLRKFYQFETLKAYSVHRVYIERLNFSEKQFIEILDFYKNSNTQVFIAIPKILRHENEALLSALRDGLTDKADGFLIRSIDGYHRVLDFGRHIVFDSGISTMNQYTAKHLMSRDHAMKYSPSLELNKYELKQLPLKDAEVIIYGHMMVMTSAQCVRKSTEGCIKDNGKIIYMEDRKGVMVPIETVCTLCYNQIYNGIPHYLIDKMDEMNEMGISDFRIEFLNESVEDVIKVLEAATGKVDSSANLIMKEFTRGHYTKGVE